MFFDVGNMVTRWVSYCEGSFYAFTVRWVYSMKTKLVSFEIEFTVTVNERIEF